MTEVARRRAAASCVLALCLGCATPDEQPALVEQFPTSSQPPPPDPAPPIVGQPPSSDELLVLARSTCHAHTSRTEGCEPDWRGLVRTPTHPRFVACELAPTGLDALRSRQLIRGQIDVRGVDDISDRHRCEIVHVDETLAPDEHGIQPLDAHSIGVVDIGISAAAQQLDVAELERGPTRVFVGLDSGRLLVASVYLRDLGPLLAIPGRELITTETLRADFDAALQRGDRMSWVGGAKPFAPQVADPDQRKSYAYTPVLSAAAPDGELHDTHHWDHASAVPLRAADGRRYLVMSFGMMKSSWVSAKSWTDDRAHRPG